MSEDRLEWFRCRQSLLLGALAALTPDEQLVYMIVLLRIYEVNGPCADDARMLSLRTHLPVRRVQVALDGLTAGNKPKLISTQRGFTNDFADAELAERESVQKRLSACGKIGASRRWEKPQQNQRNGDGHPNATALGFDAHLDLEIDRGLSPKAGESPAAPRKTRKSKLVLPEGWTPTLGDFDYAREHGFTGQRASDLADAFRDHHRARGNVMADWSAAWRTWVRNENKFSRGPRYGKAGDAENSGAGRDNGGQRPAASAGRYQTRDDAILAGMGRVAERAARKRQSADGPGPIFDNGTPGADSAPAGLLGEPHR